MKATVETEELDRLARRLFWWKEPAEALRYQTRFLAQVMAIGTWNDVQLARRHWDDDAFRAVLRNPPPGVFDPRSWSYWHWILKISPVPPLPRRFQP